MKRSSPLSDVKSRVSFDWKWAVLFSCFATKTLTAGLRKSFGVLLLPINEQLDQDVWLVGLSVSTSITFGDFIGPIAGGLSRRLGCRLVVILAGICVCLGLALASLANNIVQLSAFIFIGIGIGSGFTNDVPFAVLGRCFRDNFSLVNGFAMLGASFGMTVFGPLTAFFVDVYGWRGALLVLGGIAFNTTVFGAILKEPEHAEGQEPYIPLIKGDKTNYETIEDKEQEADLKTIWNFVSQSLDLSLFKETMFARVAAATIIMRFTMISWVIYLVPNATSKGLSNMRSSFISTTAGVGLGVGLFLPGAIIIMTNKSLSSLTLWTVGITISAVGLAVDPIVDSYIGMLILGTFQGLGYGLICATYNVVLYDYFGEERLVNSMGWVRGISGIGRAFGGFFPGWIFKATSSYYWCYVTLGIIQALSLLILHFGRKGIHCSCKKSTE